MSAGLTSMSDADLMAALGTPADQGADPGALAITVRPSGSAPDLGHLSDDDLMRQLGVATNETDVQKAETGMMPSAPKMGGGEAFLRGAEQGATLGFGDEARGVLAASPMMDKVQGSGPVSDFLAWNVRNSPLALLSRGTEGAYNHLTGQPGARDRYDATVADNRAALAQAHEQHPYATGAGQIAGGVGATVPAMLAAPAAVGAAGASLGTRLGLGAASGLGLGGVQGFGEGEGGLGNRAVNAGLGGAAGAAFGAAGVPIGSGLSAGIKAFYEMLPRRAAGLGSSATREATTALGEAGGSRQVQARLAELGPDAMLLDTAQPFLGRAQGIATIPGAPGEKVVSRLSARDAGTDARLAQGLDAALGPAPVPSQIEMQFAAKRAATSPMYERSLGDAGPVDVTSALAEVGQRLNTAAGPERAALMKARSYLVEDGSAGPMPRRDPRYLHSAKEAMDQLIEHGDTTIGVPRGTLFPKDSAVAAVRGRLNAALEEQVPGYAEANLTLRTAQRASEALASGRRVLGGGDAAIHPNDFAADLARRPLEQQAALRAGVRADLDRTVGNRANDLPALSNELQRPTDWNRAKLETTFGKDAIDQVARTVDANAAMRQSYGDVARGAQTAQRARGEEAMSIRKLMPQAGETGVMALAGALGGAGAAAVPAALKAGRVGLNAIGRASDRARNAGVAELLTMQGPERDAAVMALADLMSGRARRQAAIGPVTGAVVQGLLGSADRNTGGAGRVRAGAGLLLAR